MYFIILVAVVFGILSKCRIEICASFKNRSEAISYYYCRSELLYLLLHSISENRRLPEAWRCQRYGGYYYSSIWFLSSRRRLIISGTGKYTYVSHERFVTERSKILETPDSFLARLTQRNNNDSILYSWWSKEEKQWAIDVIDVTASN